jgi:hypothetical protein
MDDNDEDRAGQRRLWLTLPETQRLAHAAKAYVAAKETDLFNMASQSTDPMIRQCHAAWYEAQVRLNMLTRAE